MNLRGWSPDVPWSRRRWSAGRWILAALAGPCVGAAVLLGVWWLGAVAVAIAAVGVTASFQGERLDHGPRRRGGAS